MFEIIAGILIVVACFFLLATVIVVWKAPDALTRANCLGLLTSVGLPLFLVASLFHDAAQGTFSVKNLVVVVLATLGLWSVVSIAGFVMGRSLYEVRAEQD